MKKYTVEEIRQYVLSQDSLGDVLYNLSEENIDEANDSDLTEEDFEENEEL